MPVPVISPSVSAFAMTSTAISVCRTLGTQAGCNNGAVLLSLGKPFLAMAKLLARKAA